MCVLYGAFIGPKFNLKSNSFSCVYSQLGIWCNFDNDIWQQHPSHDYLERGQYAVNLSKDWQTFLRNCVAFLKDTIYLYLYSVGGLKHCNFLKGTHSCIAMPSNWLCKQGTLLWSPIHPRSLICLVLKYLLLIKVHSMYDEVARQSDQSVTFLQ